VALHLLGDTIGDTKMKYGFAFWESGFAMKYRTVRLEQSELVVELFTVFKDGSKRSNYRNTHKFKKDK
jgi:hypothetical protein